MAKLAVIGPGLIGSKHISYIEKNPLADLVAVVSPSFSPPKGVSAIASRRAYFRSVEELVNSELKFDAALICSPTQNHFEHTLALKERTGYIFVEKPVFQSKEEGEAFLKLDSSFRKRILVGHHRRHSEKFSQLEELVTSGILGDVQCYSGHICFYKPDSYFQDADWRISKGGGPLYINFIHEIDIVRKLFGDIIRVSAFASGTFPFDSEVENTLVANIQHSSGVLGSFVVSDRVHSKMNWERCVGEDSAFPHDGDDYLHILGSSGSLNFPSFQLLNGFGSDWKAPLETSTVSREGLSGTDPLARQLEHLINLCHRVDTSPVVSVDDAIKNLVVCEAIFDSVKSSGLPVRPQ